MRHRIVTTVKQFLQSRHRPGAPLLLGVSGGGDSLAMLHATLRCRRFFSLDLHVAHVDHGWRPESGAQAVDLRRHIESLGLPFYLRTLTDTLPKEEEAREARLQFFQQLSLQLGCQAVMLGHQADDQSETVLKRIFEGASLTALGGIRPTLSLARMEVWRPLLSLKKSTLAAWLRAERLTPMDDPTNGDPRYLRSRMRIDLLPQLSRTFGKGVANNLYRLGETAQELHEYLERQTEKYQGLIQDGQVDFSTCHPWEGCEIKMVLKKMAKQNNILLSYSGLQTLYTLLTKGDQMGKVGSAGGWLEVQGRLVTIRRTL